MLLPTENPRKVSNIVQAQQSQFKELYSRLVNGLPGVHWPLNSPSLQVPLFPHNSCSYLLTLLTQQQDTSPQARAALLRKLPSKLLSKLEQRYTSGAVSKEADAPAFWLKMANEPDLASSIQKGKQRPLLL
jgi:translocator assembly and maintenance protein 41